MSCIATIIKKELRTYIHSPLSFIFLVIFLLFQMGFTFVLGRLYESNHAGLEIFFTFHPWLYLFLVPAVGMRLWAEEKSEGTLETLFTLPLPLGGLVLGKFIASWLFILIALFLTFPVVITLYFLGTPDFGPIVSGYFMSWLMAGAFLSVTCFTSAMTKNQVISFVISVLICFCFVLVGYGVFQQYLTFMPIGARDFVANLGFIPHFHLAIQGVIDSRDVIYFLSIIAFFLILNNAALEPHKTSKRRV